MSDRDNAARRAVDAASGLTAANLARSAAEQDYARAVAALRGAQEGLKHNTLALAAANAKFETTAKETRKVWEDWYAICVKDAAGPPPEDMRAFRDLRAASLFMSQLALGGEG